MLEHIIKLCIYSTKINNEKPVSMLLVANTESGKSDILKKFAFIKEVKLETDFNSFIFGDFAIQYQFGNKLTLIIPDFLKVVKRRYSVSANSLTTLNAMTEEGWIGKLQSGAMIPKPIIANLITAITKEEMTDKRHKWNSIGFLSRLIPISYDYSTDSRRQIREYIKDRVYVTDKPYDFELPKEKIDIVLPKELANEIEKITMSICLRDNLTGFRLQKQLQTLTMANALVMGRSVVTQSDVDMIKQVSEFINFDFKQI